MEYNFIRSLDHDYWNNTFSQNLEDFRTKLTHFPELLFYRFICKNSNECTHGPRFIIFSHYNFPPNSFPNEVEEFNPRLNIKHTKLLFPSSRGKLERMTGKRVAPSKKQDFSRRYTSLCTAAVSIVAESRNDPIAIFHRVNATLQALATLFRFFFSFFSSPCVASIICSHTCSSFSRLIDQHTMEISPGAR